MILNFRMREGRDAQGLFTLFSEEQFLHFAAARDPFASRDDLQDWLNNLNAAQRFEVVAEAENELLGFSGLYVCGDGFGHVGWLMLGVRQNAQGQGIGSALLHIIVKTAYMFAGLRRLQLTVFCDNEMPSRFIASLVLK